MKIPLQIGIKRAIMTIDFTSYLINDTETVHSGRIHMAWQLLPIKLPGPFTFIPERFLHIIIIHGT